MKDDAAETRITLRLPTTVDVEIAPMAIVRWLESHGWHIGPRWGLDYARVVRYVRDDGSGTLLVMLDVEQENAEQFAVFAIERLAMADGVAPHVMAEQIIAADMGTTADDVQHNGPTPTDCLDLESARASVNFLRTENDALRAALKDALDVVDEIDGSGIMSLNAGTRADMARHRAMFPVAKEGTP